MKLVNHDPQFRRIWMFPRNIRKIYPWKLGQILVLLKQQLSFSNWQGNQSIQDSFSRALANAKLTSGGHLRDPHSGGARTYKAQLKSLGLLFERDGKIFFTIAGEDLAKGISPLPIIQNQLFRYQYPSSYSLGQNVKVNPQLRVKPFLFILQLLQDQDIQFLTMNEMMIPMIYGHVQDNLSLCKEKILSFRRTGKIWNVIDNPEFDLYTPRGKGRSAESALKDIRDIANTCKNYLEAASLIKTDSNSLRQQFISFNEDFIGLFEQELNNIDTFILHPEVEESFQRAYGAWNVVKDNRKLLTEDSNVQNGASIIQSLYLQHCGENLELNKYPEDFIERMRQDYGFERQFVKDTIEPFSDKTLDIFESTYLELSRGGTQTATKFETATGSLFESQLRFTVKHTGQMKRDGIGGYSDLLVIALDDVNCGIIDTKASPYYALGSSDYSKMKSNYMQNYQELRPESELQLEFCAYIAGGFKSTINQRLRTMYGETNIPVSAVSAKDFLEITKRIIEPSEQSVYRQSFKKNKLLKVSDF